MIRKATIDDFKEIQLLNRFLFEKEEKEYDSLLNVDWSFEGEGREYFEKAINDEGKTVFIAEEKGKIVGYLAGTTKKQHIYKDHCLEAEIDNMFVLEQNRDSGFGSKLVEAFVCWAKGIGVKRIEVRASSGNEKGIKFYTKNGFEDFDTVLKLDL